jgi:hypothetical protein
VVTWAAHTAPACPCTNVWSVSSKNKNGPINLCINPAHTFTSGLPLSNSHVTWILTAQILKLYLFTAPLTWNITSSEKHTWRRKSGDTVTRQFFLACPQRSLCVLLGYSVLVHESFESCYAVGQRLLCSTS